MAIISKKQKLRGHYFMHTYSDANMKIRQEETGNIYDEAWDLTSSQYTYTETDIPIEEEGDSVED